MLSKAFLSDSRSCSYSYSLVYVSYACPEKCDYFGFSYCFYCESCSLVDDDGDELSYDWCWCYCCCCL